MNRREYVIQGGDTFYQLAQRWGGTCADWQRANPGANPGCLQIGQVIIMPDLSNSSGSLLSDYRALPDVAVNQNVDEVELEVEGVIFRVRRQGESQVPHEVQLIIPRTEIRKVQHGGEICELQIMLSNVNIVHSPRLSSGNKEQAEIKQDLLPVPRTEQGEAGSETGFHKAF